MNELASPRAAGHGAPHLPFAAEMIRPTTDRGVGTQSPFLRQTLHRVQAGGAGDAADQRPRPLPGLHQRPARRRRPADARAGPATGSASATRPTTSRDLLRAGENSIDIWLGDGWFRSRMMWPRNQILNTWGDEIGAIAELRDAAGEVLARHRCELAERAHCRSCKSRHLFRRELRRPRRERRRDRRRRSARRLRQVDRSLPHETTACASSTTLAGGRVLRRCRGPHRLRFRPEHRRLRRLHRRGRGRRQGHRRACRSARPATASSTTSTCARPKPASNTC